MNKRLVFVPVGAVTIGAAIVYLSSKTRAKKKAGAKTVAKTVAKGGAKPASQLKTAAYSFASGYKENAKTVEVRLAYDPDEFTYAVASEDFISETGDAHAGILRGEDFGIQLEYAAYFGGEDFEGYAAHIAQRNKGFEKVTCNGINGIKFFDGKNLCLAFPAASAEADYVLVTAVAAGDNNDMDAAALWNSAEVKTVLSSLTISAT